MREFEGISQIRKSREHGPIRTGGAGNGHGGRGVGSNSGVPPLVSVKTSRFASLAGRRSARRKEAPCHPPADFLRPRSPGNGAAGQKAKTHWEETPASTLAGVTDRVLEVARDTLKVRGGEKK